MSVYKKGYMKEMNKISQESLDIDVDLTDLPLRDGDKINIQAITFRQIERTNKSAMEDENKFASNVRLLMTDLPKHKKAAIEDRSDEYLSKSKSYSYKYFCGVPLGTIENPVNGSPFVVEEEVIDWYKLYEIILEIFEECGITWKFDSWTVETGKIIKKQKEFKETPVFKKQVPKEPEVAQKKEYIRRCAVCEKQIKPGTGTTYHLPSGKGKLVHIEKCYKDAEVKWKEI